MKTKILVVNDDPYTRELFRNALVAKGHRVVLAGTGAEGVKLFITESFDLLLLDVDLPDTSGWNIYKTLRSINPCMPIVITGNTNEQELLIFEDGAIPVKLLEVTDVLRTIAGSIRQSPTDSTPMPVLFPRHGEPHEAGIVAMTRVS